MLLAISALQGGAGLPILPPTVYEYIVSKEKYSPEKLSANDVPHHGMKLRFTGSYSVIILSVLLLYLYSTLLWLACPLRYSTSTVHAFSC